MTRSRQTADWGSRAGLAKIIPSSLTLSSGTGSVSSTGLVTFSSVGSIIMNNCFTSGYANYKIVGNLQASTGMTVYGRVASSGTPYTGGTYSFAVFGKGSGNADNSLYSTSVSYVSLFTAGSSNEDFELTAFQPYVASTRTQLVWQKNGLNSGYGPAYFTGGAFVDDSSQYDGFYLLASTGTISGTMRVYGYN